jgi:hypothetical protein
MTDLPTLTHLRAYNTDHLADAAAHWTQAAGRWDNTFITAEQETHLLGWEGRARESGVERIARDHDVVRANAGALEQAANVAREASSSLLTAAHAVTHLADEATENGYIVGDDYEVDFPPTANLAEYKTRSVQAEQYSADLRFRAGNFMAHEHQTASDLIQAVDNHTDGDGAVHYTPTPHPPVVINEHGGKTPVPADPRDHVGTAHEIIEGLKKVGVGGVTAAGGGLSIAAGAAAEVPTLGTSTIPIVGGIGAVGAGSADIYLGLDDLSHLTNMGRRPDAPPIAGQDGPG